MAGTPCFLPALDGNQNGDIWLNDDFIQFFNFHDSAIKNLRVFGIISDSLEAASFCVNGVQKYLARPQKQTNIGLPVTPDFPEIFTICMNDTGQNVAGKVARAAVFLDKIPGNYSSQELQIIQDLSEAGRKALKSLYPNNDTDKTEAVRGSIASLSPHDPKQCSELAEKEILVWSEILRSNLDPDTGLCIFFLHTSKVLQDNKECTFLHMVSSWTVEFLTLGQSSGQIKDHINQNQLCNWIDKLLASSSHTNSSQSTKMLRITPAAYASDQTDKNTEPFAFKIVNTPLENIGKFLPNDKTKLVPSSFISVISSTLQQVNQGQYMSSTNDTNHACSRNSSESPQPSCKNTQSVVDSVRESTIVLCINDILKFYKETLQNLVKEIQAPKVVQQLAGTLNALLLGVFEEIFGTEGGKYISDLNGQLLDERLGQLEDINSKLSTKVKAALRLYEQQKAKYNEVMERFIQEQGHSDSQAKLNVHKKAILECITSFEIATSDQISKDEPLEEHILALTSVLNTTAEKAYDIALNSQAHDIEYPRRTNKLTEQTKESDGGNICYTSTIPESFEMSADTDTSNNVEATMSTQPFTEQDHKRNVELSALENNAFLKDEACTRGSSPCEPVSSDGSVGGFEKYVPDESIDGVFKKDVTSNVAKKRELPGEREPKNAENFVNSTKDVDNVAVDPGREPNCLGLPIPDIDKEANDERKVDKEFKELPGVDDQTPILESAAIQISSTRIGIACCLPCKPNSKIATSNCSTEIGLTNDGSWVVDSIGQDLMHSWRLKDFLQPGANVSPLEKIKIAGEVLDLSVDFLLAMCIKFLIHKHFGRDKVFWQGAVLVSVPIWFANKQRQQVLNACELAGIPKAVLVNESSAAAYSFFGSGKNLGAEVVVVSENSKYLDVSFYEYSQTGWVVLLGHAGRYDPRHSKENKTAQSNVAKTVKELWDAAKVARDNVRAYKREISRFVLVQYENMKLESSLKASIQNTMTRGDNFVLKDELATLTGLLTIMSLQRFKTNQCVAQVLADATTSTSVSISSQLKPDNQSKKLNAGFDGVFRCTKSVHANQAQQIFKVEQTRLGIKENVGTLTITKPYKTYVECFFSFTVNYNGVLCFDQNLTIQEYCNSIIFNKSKFGVPYKGGCEWKTEDISLETFSVSKSICDKAKFCKFTNIGHREETTSEKNKGSENTTSQLLRPFGGNERESDIESASRTVGRGHTGQLRKSNQGKQR